MPPLTGTESFIEHAGHRIAILSHPNPGASRPPVVWIHGLTASFRFWEAAMYEEIRRDRSWYSISLPLHYPSTYSGDISAGDLSETLFARLFSESVDSVLPGKQFHLVGYSLGGFAALNYAAKYPERVLSIVSVGGFMNGRARGLEGVLQFLSRGDNFRRAAFHAGWWVLQRHVIFLKLATLFYARKRRRLLSYPALDPTLENIFPDVRRHDINSMRSLFRYLLDMDLLDELDQLSHPVLVIAGNQDPVIPFHHQREYATYLRNATIEVLEGVGHVAFAEAPERFERVVLDWLRQHDRSSAGNHGERT